MDYIYIYICCLFCFSSFWLLLLCFSASLFFSFSASLLLCSFASLIVCFQISSNFVFPLIRISVLLASLVFGLFCFLGRLIFWPSAFCSFSARLLLCFFCSLLFGFFASLFLSFVLACSSVLPWKYNYIWMQQEHKNDKNKKKQEKSGKHSRPTRITTPAKKNQN